MKTVLKILGALLGLVAVLVIGLVAFAAVTLKPHLPASEFALQAAAGGGRHVLLFGATGKLGSEIAQDLAEQGDQVTAFVRATSDRSRLEPLGVHFVVGDVLDPPSIAAAFSTGKFDAAILAIAGVSEPTLDRQGNVNVADGAKGAGVARVILISTVGAGNSHDAAPLISRLALSRILPQKSAAEEHLRASKLDYTILRPGGLPPGVVPTGRGVLSVDPATMGFIKRPDLARLVVGVLHDDRTIGKTFAVVDPGLQRPWGGAD
ncbi:MAG: SDR family oxidoreductase [Gammaproteobacteria bacterium]